MINSTRSQEDSVTEVKLVSLSTQPHFGSWKQVNPDDFTEEENKQLKQTFQKKVLSSLR